MPAAPTREQRLIAEMLAALRPFAEWARGLASVEQPDAFEYHTLDDEGRQMWGSVDAQDFANVLSAVAKAEEMRS